MLAKKVGRISGFDVFCTLDAIKIISDYKVNVYLINAEGIEFITDPIKVTKHEICHSNNGSSTVKLWPECKVESKEVLTFDDQGYGHLKKAEYLGEYLIKDYIPNEQLSVIYPNYRIDILPLFNDSGKFFRGTVAESREYRLRVMGDNKDKLTLSIHDDYITIMHMKS